jgi:hypothetical protein
MLRTLPPVALVALWALSAPGQAAPLAHNNDNHRGTAPASEPAAYTTKAAVAYYYTRGEGDRSKNVSSFTNPGTGTYCITPSISLKLSKIYPHVTVEYEDSAGSSLAAFWSNNGPDCPTGSLEVITADFSGNFSSAVAFVFTVE